MPVLDKVYQRTGTEPDKELPAYAWPGGYPFYYFAALYEDQLNDFYLLCPECANKHNEYDDVIWEVDVNYEDNDSYCENCNRILESAYGEDA